MPDIVSMIYLKALVGKNIGICLSALSWAKKPSNAEALSTLFIEDKKVKKVQASSISFRLFLDRKPIPMIYFLGCGCAI